MKRLFKLAFLIVIVGTVIYTVSSKDTYFYRWLNFSFCDKPIHYKIGKVDNQFNLSLDQLKDSAQAGAAIWNGILRKELFTYDPNALLEISLIYDERQRALRTVTTEKELVEKDKNLLDVSAESFEQKKAEVEEKLHQLNSDIQYYNSIGGAPKDVYDQLISRQKNIQREIAEINAFANSLNQKADEINSKIEGVNKSVGNFNEILQTLPEEGLYIAHENKIEIYIVENENRLAITIAHELGHALGLDHIAKESAIMNPTASETTAVTQEDKDLLVSYCKQQNRLDLIKNDLANIVQFLKSTWQK